MAEVIKMPLMSDTMEEGVIVEWHKKEGDKVQPGDVLAEVETDKATMELESYQEGTLLHIAAKGGETVPVNSIIAIIGEKGEDYQSLLKKDGESKSAAKEEQLETSKSAEKEKTKSEEKPEKPAEAKQKAPEQPGPRTSGGDNGRVKISPLARKMAEEKGIDIHHLKGSGDEGRIIKRDIETYQAPAATGGYQFTGEEYSEEIKVSQMRKTIAKRLSESKYGSPHYYLTLAIDMKRAAHSRKRINEVEGLKISFNDMIIKAAAMALRKHPWVNSSWKGDTVSQHKHIHIGMAVAIDDGLIVPVIRFADNKSLSQISMEARELAGRARNKELQPEEFSGNTFSISNLGMMDIEQFTAIINPPDSCIMAIGAVQETPVVQEGNIVPGLVMKVTLSCDHRVVDGATGAAFLQTFKSYLEEPVRMLV